MDDEALIATWLAKHRPTRLPPGKARGADDGERWSIARSKANASSRAHPSNRHRWRASAKEAAKQRGDRRRRADARKHK
jgi:hypothetical protein